MILGSRILGAVDVMHVGVVGLESKQSNSVLLVFVFSGLEQIYSRYIVI